jgi:Protein of unknown function (DUF3040)
MALSMEEQRILAGIEQELERSEPALAAYLSAFGRPGRAGRAALCSSRPRASRPPPLLRSARGRLHSPRVLVLASLAALILLTVIPVLVYTLVSLHAVPNGHPAGRSAVPAQQYRAPLPHPVTNVPR